jgi:hypothetical protein
MRVLNGVKTFSAPYNLESYEAGGVAASNGDALYFFRNVLRLSHLIQIRKRSFVHPTVVETRLAAGKINLPLFLCLAPHAGGPRGDPA